MRLVLSLITIFAVAVLVAIGPKMSTSQPTFPERASAPLPVPDLDTMFKPYFDKQDAMAAACKASPECVAKAMGALETNKKGA